MNKLIKHFLVPDHLSFLAIVVFLCLAVIRKSWFLVGLAILCWFFAFIWDIAEEKVPLIKKIENWFKGD